MQSPAVAEARRRRGRRVVFLLLAILVLSLADLAATIVNLTSIGMDEANPLARAIVLGFGSTWALVAYKLLTLSVCLGLLYRLRWHRQSEAAAWFGVLILCALTVHWGRYSAVAHQPDVVAAQHQGVVSEYWLTLAE